MFDPRFPQLEQEPDLPAEYGSDRSHMFRNAGVRSKGETHQLQGAGRLNVAVRRRDRCRGEVPIVWAYT